MKHTLSSTPLVICSILWLHSLALFSQVSITGTLHTNNTPGTATYTNHFNTLPNQPALNQIWIDNSTLVDWYADQDQYDVDDGGNTSSDLKDYGDDNAPDRALGALSSSTKQPIYGIGFINNTGSTILQIQVIYTGEQWRRGGSGHINTLNFQYQQADLSDVSDGGNWLDVDALDFHSVNTGTPGASLDGNANKAYISSIFAVNVPNGSEVWLRWADQNDTGSDDGLAIDDLTINFGDGSLPLPIELVQFQAKKQDQKVELNWQTVSEINHHYFSIERSPNGHKFSEIGQQLGAGNTFKPKKYTFEDNAPFRGLNYYRSKQIDYDGHFSYSHMIFVPFNDENQTRIFPNPFSNELIILFEKSIEEEAHIEVFNIFGQLEKVIWLDGGIGETSIDLSELKKGHYLLKIWKDYHLEILKIVKSR